MIVGIDPGPTKAGLVLYDEKKKVITYSGHQTWEEIRNYIKTTLSIIKIDHIAIEKVIIYSYIPGSAKILPDSIENVGRIVQMADDLSIPVTQIIRIDVITELTGSRPNRAKPFGKKEMKDWIKKYLKLLKPITPVHATDAAAVAIAVANRIKKANRGRKQKAS